MMNDAIQISQLSVFYGHTPAITNINLNVQEGEYLGIIGPNGGGKTTLLNSVLGLIKPTSGNIKIYNGAVKNMRDYIGYVPQIAEMDKKFPISALETVMTAFLKNGFHPFFTYKKKDEYRAMEQLERMQIDKLAHRQVSELSGGEFQRLLIARALAADPKILLLDEPTASVDPASRAQIYDLLSKLNDAGMTIVMVTHDMLAVASSINKLACLNHRIVYHGEPQLTDDVCTAMYGCPIDLIAYGVPHRVLRNHDEGEI